MDKLEQLFNKQKILQKRLFDIDLPNYRPEKFPITVTSIVSELGEILEEAQGWKDWRKNVPAVKRYELLYEVVDLWHFIINLTLYCGIDYEELHKYFLLKNAVNHQRQEDKY